MTNSARFQTCEHCPWRAADRRLRPVTAANRAFSKQRAIIPKNDSDTTADDVPNNQPTEGQESTQTNKREKYSPVRDRKKSNDKLVFGEIVSLVITLLICLLARTYFLRFYSHRIIMVSTMFNRWLVKT
jgi:hypothetical protein